MPSIDASGLIPTSQSAELITATTTSSAVLQLARRVPMPTGMTAIPILAALPDAGFVGAGARKPWTNLGFSNPVLKPEEVAATISIPQVYVDDSGVNVWDAARPEMAAALGRAIDDAVFFGNGAPATFPVGGITAGLIPVAGGDDAVDTVNQAMAEVENTGLPVTAHAADLRVKSVLRGVRDANNALLLGFDQVGSNTVQTLYGVPISWQLLDSETIDFITGDWTKLIVGVRQDIRYELSNQGVIADADGKVLISAFQDDQILMRIYMRLGFVLAKPVGPRGQTQPFAVAKLSPAGVGTEGLSVETSGDGTTVDATTTQAAGKK